MSENKKVRVRVITPVGTFWGKADTGINISELAEFLSSANNMTHLTLEDEHGNEVVLPGTLIKNSAIIIEDAVHHYKGIA